MMQCPEYSQEPQQLKRGIRDAQMTLNVLTVRVGRLFKLLNDTELIKTKNSLYLFIYYCILF